MNESRISMFLGALVIIVVGVLVANYFRNLSSPNNGERDLTGTTTNQEVGETYTVEAGDSLWTISEEVYDTGYNWTAIAEANNLTSPSDITEGQVLSIPELSPTPDSDEEDTLAEATETPVSATAEPTVEPTPSPTLRAIAEQQDSDEGEMESGGSYTVVQGDTLWDIAQEVYGDPYQWVKIAEANNLQNPDLIHPGNTFVIPQK